MTECGMVLSHQYDSERIPGTVGVPLPGVSIRINEETEKNENPKIILECTNLDGEVIFNKKNSSEEHLKGNKGDKN